MNRKNFFLLFFMLLTYSCTSTNSLESSPPPPPRRDLSHLSKPKNLKLLWISLDAFSLSYLENFTKYIENPHPRGLQYLLAQTQKISELRINDPTFTAPSHISTITCAPPQETGVFANSQWDGKQFENGFEKSYPTQTFLRALIKSGWKVGSLAYPSIDGTNAERSASFGYTYDVPPSKGFFAVVPLNGSASLEIPIRNSGEIFKVDAFADASGGVVTYQHEKTKLAQHADKNWANLYFKSKGRNQHVAILNLGTEGKKVRIYVSPTMINKAYPKDYANDLDAQNLVFSAGKDYKLKKEMGDLAFFKTLQHRLEFMGESAIYSLSKQDPDALFLYFEDLDTIGHHYAGRFDSIKPLLEKHISLLDQEIGKILNLVDEKTLVVVVGDHGMATAKEVVNVNAILPTSSRPFSVVQASGGSLFIYPRGKNVLSSPPTTEKWFVETVNALKNAKISGQQNIFSHVVTKNSIEARNLKIDHKNLPWIVAFSSPGLQLEATAEEKVFSDKPPNTAGNHGYSSFSKEMKASAIFFGNTANSIDLKKIQSNIDMVPIVADSLGVKRPEACQNRSY